MNFSIVMSENSVCIILVLFTVVSWPPVPLDQQVTKLVATTVNNTGIIANAIRCTETDCK